MRYEEQSFMWTIENFHVIRLHKSTIDCQKIYFTAGTPRYPSKWRVYLEEKLIDGKRWIGIYLKRRGPTLTLAAFKTWYDEIRFTIKNKDEVIIEDDDIGPGTDYANRKGRRYWYIEKFIDAEDDSVCPEGTLVLQVKFYLYDMSMHSQPKPESLEAIMDRFQVKFSDKLRKDLAGLLKNPEPSLDIKIVSRDKKEFTMQRGILAVRSDVFAAMLSSDMIEANSGVINLPDISSRALKVLLTFMFAGGLDPDWNHAKVLVELTNAAAKYQLPDLLQFLDATLGRVCKVENVLELFTLAQQLELKTAEVELYKSFPFYSISLEVCSKMSIPGLDQSVHHSLPKRKSGSRTLFSSPFKGLFGKN